MAHCKSKAFSSQPTICSSGGYQRWRFCSVLLLVLSSTLNHDLERFKPIQLNIVHVLLTTHQVVRFFRFRDYATVAAVTAFSVPVGYIFGSIPNLHATAICIIPIVFHPCASLRFFFRTSHSRPCVVVCRSPWLNRWFHRCVSELECSAVRIR